MEVTNPRRILAVSLASSTQHLARVITDLTGSTPEGASTSLAGTNHDLPLKTAYYTATVPIWLDLMTSPAEWAESFLSDEARQVLAVLGGVLLVFAIPSSPPPPPPPGESTAAADADDGVAGLIRHVGRVVQERLGGLEWDGVKLAVGVGEGDAEEWDALCTAEGFEFVQVGGAQKERNEFGEKTGIPRVREALESNDWAFDDHDDRALEQDEEGQEEGISGGSDQHGTDSNDLDTLDYEVGFHATVVGELTKALVQEREALDEVEDQLHEREVRLHQLGAGFELEEDEEEEGMSEADVAKLERMMRTLQAAKEMGEGLSEPQKKRWAARAVKEVLRNL